MALLTTNSTEPTLPSPAPIRTIAKATEATLQARLLRTPRLASPALLLMQRFEPTAFSAAAEARLTTSSSLLCRGLSSMAVTCSVSRLVALADGAKLLRLPLLAVLRVSERLWLSPTETTAPSEWPMLRALELAVTLWQLAQSKTRT